MRPRVAGNYLQELTLLVEDPPVTPPPIDPPMPNQVYVTTIEAVSIGLDGATLITHNLGSRYVDCVFRYDGEEIEPDDVIYAQNNSTNQLVVQLQSFVPYTGYISVQIERVS